VRRITAEDYELLGFFEVEPEQREPDESWLHTDSVYTVLKNELELSFCIHPMYRDVKLVLSHKGNPLYQLDTMGVNDVTVVSSSDHEYLDIHLEDEHRILVYLKPQIIVKQHVEIET